MVQAGSALEARSGGAARERAHPRNKLRRNHPQRLLRAPDRTCAVRQRLFQDSQNQELLLRASSVSPTLLWVLGQSVVKALRRKSVLAPSCLLLPPLYFFFNFFEKIFRSKPQL